MNGIQTVELRGHLTVMACPFCGFTRSLRSDTAKPSDTHNCPVNGGIVMLSEVTDPVFKMAIARKDGV